MLHQFSIRNLELAEDIGYVVADRPGCYSKPGGDLWVCEPLGRQNEHDDL
jgi:hypothetical protein